MKGDKTTKKTAKPAQGAAVDPFESTVEVAPKTGLEPSTRSTGGPSAIPRTEHISAVEPPKPRAGSKKKNAAKPVEPFAEIAREKPREQRTAARSSTARPRSQKSATAVKRAARKTSSPVKRAATPAKTVTVETAASVENFSPVFKALADVKLPRLASHARARLLVQSPTRLYFYWSLKNDPWQQLRAVFGADQGYRLVLKLRNVTAGTEDIYPGERRGEWWFNAVMPDCEYTVEIGFYATNRPYFRVLYSNSVSTPRSSPSPHPANEARWTVSATKFAEVLDASGFSRDAVDVAIAGGDHNDADERTRAAFAEFTGAAQKAVSGVASEELRHALISVATGAKLEELRDEIPPRLFEIIRSAGDAGPESARRALAAHFDVDEEEWSEHQYGPAVFGASSIHFPKTLRPRKSGKYSQRYNPISSFTLGR